jgi:hypothetical protein
MRLKNILTRPLVVVLCLVSLCGVSWSRHKSRSRSERGTRGRSSRDRHNRTAARSSDRRRRGDRRSERASIRGKRGRFAGDRRRGRGRYEARYARRHPRYARARYARSYESEPVGAAPTRPLSGIPADRVTEIQKALIKAGYMTGEPTGQYDSATSSAMKQFQAGNGLQATGLPSAQSLKKLGVSKGSNDGYAVPVKGATETGKKPDAQAAPPEKTKPIVAPPEHIKSAGPAAVPKKDQ